MGTYIYLVVLCFISLCSAQELTAQDFDLSKLTQGKEFDPFFLQQVTRDIGKGNLICHDITIRGLSRIAVYPNAAAFKPIGNSEVSSNVTLIVKDLKFECDFVFYKTVILIFKGRTFGTIGSTVIPMQITEDDNGGKPTIDYYRFIFEDIVWDLEPTNPQAQLVINPFTKWAVKIQFTEARNDILRKIAEEIMQAAQQN